MTTITVKIADLAQQRANVMSNPVFLQALTATPAEVDAWVLNNVTTLAQARPVLSLLMQAVAYLMNQQNAGPP